MQPKKEIGDKFNEFNDAELFDFDIDTDMVVSFFVKQKDSIVPSKADDMILAMSMAVSDAIKGA